MNYIYIKKKNWLLKYKIVGISGSPIVTPKSQQFE